jgi:hypothetical protein
MEQIAGAVVGGGIDFLAVALPSSIGIFALITMISLPLFGRFRGIGPLDAASRAAAGGVFVTSVLASLIALYIAGYNLVNVPSSSFPFEIVLILCLLGLVIWMGPVIACAWLSAKWLLRPVHRRSPE